MTGWDSLNALNDFLTKNDTQEYLPPESYDTGYSGNSPAYERSQSKGAMRDRTNRMIADSNADRDRSWRALLGIGTAVAPDSEEYAAYKRQREAEKRSERPAYTYTWEEGATQKGVPIKDVKRPPEGYNPDIRNPWEQAPGNQSAVNMLGMALNQPQVASSTPDIMDKFNTNGPMRDRFNGRRYILEGESPDYPYGRIKDQGQIQFQPGFPDQGENRANPGVAASINQGLNKFFSGDTVQIPDKPPGPTGSHVLGLLQYLLSQGVQGTVPHTIPGKIMNPYFWKWYQSNILGQ